MDKEMMELGRLVAHQQLLTYCLAHLFSGDETFKEKLDDMRADCRDNMIGTAQALKDKLGATDEHVRALSTACNDQIDAVLDATIKLLSAAKN